MKHTLLIALLLIAATTHSQNVINVDKGDVNRQLSLAVVNGNALKPDKYVRVVEGSPYFRKEWMKGEMRLANGKYANSVALRIDLMDNSIEYLDQYGHTMIATNPVVKIILTDSVSGESFYFIHSSMVPELSKHKEAWYQLLDSSSIGLYKLISKRVDERRPYNSATYEQSIEDVSEYYLPYNKVIYKIKKLNDIAALFSNKKSELETYISKKKLKGKKDADYLELLHYYNSL